VIQGVSSNPSLNSSMPWSDSSGSSDTRVPSADPSDPSHFNSTAWQLHGQDDIFRLVGTTADVHVKMSISE